MASSKMSCLQQAGLAVPTRPCRRMLLILTLWTCLCYLVFKVTSGDDLMKVAVDLTSTGGSGPAINTRELLQKVMAETRKPPPMTAQGGSTTESPLLNPLDLEPAIDKSPQKDEKTVLQELASKLPNLPLVYLHENKGKNWHAKGNKTCAKFPTIYDLHISNVYWQETETSNGTFYLYGAYMDKRRQNRLGPTVRILGMINRLEPSVKTFCQFWFTGVKEPVIAKVLEYKYIWFKKWGNYKHGLFQPYLLACQLPKSHWRQVPVSVSIVEHQCDTATNNLRVIYNSLKPNEPKKGFGVCVKGLDFPTSDLSVRLIEWIELLGLLGADKIFLYNLEVHPNVTKVLDYYAKRGQVDVTPLSLPGYQPNMEQLQHLYLKSKLNNKRQNEVIPYNDCLYRNMYRYEYLALLDIDEVIMPLQKASWGELMKDVVAAALKAKNETRASYNFRNVYFMDSMLPEPSKEVPPYLHMLQHVYRSANYTKPGQYVKCFHNPEKVLILHNHFPLGCLGGVCTSYPVSTAQAHLQHYRADCVNTLKKSCASVYRNNSVKDTTIWRHKQPLVARTTEALSSMGFFKVPAQQPGSGVGGVSYDSSATP